MDKTMDENRTWVNKASIRQVSRIQFEIKMTLWTLRDI